MKNNIGLGLRREIAKETLAMTTARPDFLELAPENWMRLGGHWRQVLEQAAEQFPLIPHGISLSIGSTDPLDIAFLKEVKAFLDHYQIDLYSEHLCFSKCDNAHLFELFPMPFTQEAVEHLVARIKTTQEIIERPLTLELISYYSVLAAEMTEAEFISAVVRESGCKLLLDVNNVFINASNHGYNPFDFIQKLPLDAVSYLHIAGHTVLEDGFLIDTHAAAVAEPVYGLLSELLGSLSADVPILLERDSAFEGVDGLGQELERLRALV